MDGLTCIARALRPKWRLSARCRKVFRSRKSNGAALNVDVAESDGNIVFLHKIVPGSASRSYGIHVAKLAGVPKSLLSRAEAILSELEGGDNSQSKVKVSKPKENSDQLSFFDLTPDPILTKLRELDLMTLTPSEAFKILEELKKSTDK